MRENFYIKRMSHTESTKMDILTLYLKEKNKDPEFNEGTLICSEDFIRFQCFLHERIIKELAEGYEIRNGNTIIYLVEAWTNILSDLEESEDDGYKNLWIEVVQSHLFDLKNLYTLNSVNIGKTDIQICTYNYEEDL